eukprot:comp19729_c0_seq2/m.23517 comp19729_c0_seq2/g.23517  ORF comp19729_c0_seq2/g.23517 comp19729_c0_seq2/m.23517 type:complete len:113 (-) comp19729_c0_seq2:456-794(-)
MRRWAIGARWCSKAVWPSCGANRLNAGLFMRTVDFRAVGGFPDQVFMEDYELVRLMAQKGAVRIVPPQVRTSPRRWQAKGAVGTTLLNQWFVLNYAVLGLDARTIHTWYYGT